MIARNVYGVGETEHVRFNLDRNFYQQGLFARDNFQGIHENLWGVHPYFTAMTESGSAYGILLFNSNAMDITFNRKMVTWRTTGGILDFFIFTGPSKDFHQISLKLFFIFYGTIINLKVLPLRSKKAGRFLKLFGFSRSHSIVTRGSVSLSCAPTPHPFCFSKS